MASTAAVRDLREWMERAEDIGEISTIEGAHWEDEIGVLTDLAQQRPDGPALLFDSIPGYPKGYRILSNPLSSMNRTALSLGLPLDRKPADYVELWRQRLVEVKPIPPVVVETGSVMENVQRGDDINLLAFPSPKWHEGDGGRYLGTGSVTLTRDPDDGWVNLGTYRMMVLDEKRITLYISPGHHGRIHYERYFERGKPCPVAVSFGHDPLLFMAGSMDIPFGVSEYDYAGGLRGAPYEVIVGPHTGLPFPAHSEFVLEGECLPGDVADDGPLGEYTGYYASGAIKAPVVHIKAIYHRNNPIVLGSSSGRPPAGVNQWRCVMKSAQVMQQLEAAGVPGVTGVWFHAVGGTVFFLAVSIRQMFPGHVRQAGQIAAFCGAAAYMGRYIIVVDEDVDVSDLDHVLWALCTRSDPEHSIKILDRAWSGPLDPIIPKERAGHSSRAIIDACRPWEWRKDFPAEIRNDPELVRQLMEKWGSALQRQPRKDRRNA